MELIGAMHDPVADAVNAMKIAYTLRAGAAMVEPVEEKFGGVPVIANFDFFGVLRLFVF